MTASDDVTSTQQAVAASASTIHTAMTSLCVAMVTETRHSAAAAAVFFLLLVDRH